ncbi:LytTR family DNA-binding domain-containing protein [Gelidibacter gilvus]|uniref:LytTR family transcriptional regulator n=1 Tax=Gelidibacter gilvus TaxID=59602 RepID=A0A4Q0XEH1_9FLAO|nr:LytTR family DNA-binding domain-containing protein [Gelidibacter gilvus]RXJ49548.1 LytTR family transcriptional regulator [Gelidibacter gilvus]
MVIIIGRPTAILNRLIAAFAPSRPPLYMSDVQSWVTLAEQARTYHALCVIINLDLNFADLEALGPAWAQPLLLPYIIGMTNDISRGFTAFKYGLHDVYGPGDCAIHVVKRYQQAIRSFNGYLYFESGKKKLYLKSNEILFLKADNYTTDLFLTSGQTIPLFNTLKSYAQYLPSTFVRIQKSLVINTQFLYAVESTKRKCWLIGYAGVFIYSPIYIKNPTLLVRQPEN